MDRESQQERVRDIIDRIVGLPTLPTMLVELNKRMMDPNVSAKEVGQLISHDPAITAKILRIVNSSFYGFPNRIDTITHAIVILGFNTIKNIVFSSFVFDAFPTDPKSNAYDRFEFWRHSVACGAASKSIASLLGEKQLEDFFIRGLLHDVGKIVLDQFLHPDFLKIQEIVAVDKVLIREAEIRVLGVDHANLSEYLLTRWGLSEGLVRAVACHHEPEKAGKFVREASIVHLGDIVSRAMLCGSGGDHSIPRIDPFAWGQLGFSASDFREMFRLADLEVEKARVFMDLASRRTA